jgi:hypothetical protein
VRCGRAGTPGRLRVDERRLHPRDHGRGLERALHHVVDVQRGGELDEGRLLGLRLGGLDGRRQVPHRLLHSRRQMLDRVGHTPVGVGPGAPDRAP